MDALERRAVDYATSRLPPDMLQGVLEAVSRDGTDPLPADVNCPRVRVTHGPLLAGERHFTVEFYPAAGSAIVAQAAHVAVGENSAWGETFGLRTIPM